MSPASPRDRLRQLGPDAVHPGLGRIRALLQQLGNPHLGYPTAIVAGTNGKGSTVAMLASIARAAGLRVGAYTSPHLVDLEERGIFRFFDGTELSRMVRRAGFRDIEARPALGKPPQAFVVRATRP